MPFVLLFPARKSFESMVKTKKFCKAELPPGGNPFDFFSTELAWALNFQC